MSGTFSFTFEEIEDTESLNRRRIDNTMVKRKWTKGEITRY
jgi:hypothetical protein